MGFIKTTYIFTTIMIITVIRQVSADTDAAVAICKALLKSQFKVDSDPFEGQDNLKNSYVNLSLKQIKIKYGEPQKSGESDLDFRKRKLQKKLITKHFLNILAVKKSDLKNLLLPYDWCYRREHVDLKVPKEIQVAKCTDSIIQRLFGNDGLEVNKERIFEMFYKQWSIYDLSIYTEKHIDPTVVNVPMNEREQYYIYDDMFHLYFYHYERLVNTLPTTEEYKNTVREYCTNEGHIAVTESQIL